MPLDVNIRGYLQFTSKKTAFNITSNALLQFYYKMLLNISNGHFFRVIDAYTTLRKIKF
jgi:hypothetical protein